jgi:hypothetical protein
MTNVHFYKYILLGIWSLQILQEDLLVIHVGLPSVLCFLFQFVLVSSLGLNFSALKALPNANGHPETLHV